VDTRRSAAVPERATAIRDEFNRALLGWWDAGHRDLPWRRTRDPYAVLVSEVMLQQTQAERVAPKWQQFLEAFPTVEALAAAHLAAVIRAWSGLGYNRRAVYLHRMARAVVAQHGGRVPAEVHALRRLPGVGPYTARAVAAIAFGLPAAAVDTNVRRVLTRVLDGDTAPLVTWVQAAADALVPAERPGDWNQALMELGATVCTAATPQCQACPVRHLCAAAPRIRSLREREGRYRAPPARRPQGRFPGSRRYYRGRIVELLRRAAGADGLTAVQIGAQLRLDFGADDFPWLQGLLVELNRDGLVVWDGEKARLPQEA
jgi:A/G-specific adenine glycosylase